MTKKKEKAIMNEDQNDPTTTSEPITEHVEQTEPKPENRTMLDFFVACEGVVNGATRNVFIQLRDEQNKPSAYTAADFIRSIKKGEFDLEALKAELGVEEVTIKAVRLIDERTPKMVMIPKMFV
jgi:hypothetical protein